MDLSSFDFSPSSLIAGFVFGVFGLYLFRWGKKDANFSHLFTGLALMIYPYFVSGVFLTWGIGFSLLGVAYFTRNQ